MYKILALVAIVLGFSAFPASAQDNNIDTVINEVVPDPPPGVIYQTVNVSASGYKWPVGFKLKMLMWNDADGYHEKLYVTWPPPGTMPTPLLRITLVINYPSGPIAIRGGFYRAADGSGLHFSEITGP